MTTNIPPQQPKAWSFSALDSFETCPRKHYLTNVTKAVKEPPSEHIIWGREVHEALDKRVASGTPLPKGMQHWESLAERISQLKGDLFTERKFAISRSHAPVSWFDKSVWCRGVVDVGVTNGENGVALDWKTGKRKPGSDQLKLFAAMMFHHYQWLKRVTTGYIWLPEKKIDKQTFTREELPAIWSDFLPRVKAYEDAFLNGDFPPKPSGLCRNYCYCSSCEYCGKR